MTHVSHFDNPNIGYVFIKKTRAAAFEQRKGKKERENERG